MAPEAAIELAKEPDKKPSYRYASDPLTLIQREEKLIKQKEKLAKEEQKKERPKIVIAVIVMVCLNGITGCGTGNSEELQLIQQINISGTITNSQAERLSKVKFLELESLTTITDEQVEILSNVRELWLSGLTSITDAVSYTHLTLPTKRIV